MLYETIYDFFYDEVFNTSYLSGYHMTIMSVDTTIAEYLSHSVTILLLGLGVFWLILVVRWIFRVCAGLVNKI